MNTRTCLRPIPGVAIVLLVAACQASPASPTKPVTAAELAQVAAVITPEAVGAHVAWLAADAQRGRGRYGPGLAASADYLANIFRQAGLTPGGDGGSFLQHFDCQGVTGDDRPANVIAWRRGSNARLASEWVVVTAHYDGLGVRAPDARGDSIYNGADDDASGTAALAEAARAYARLSRASGRSVAFIAMAGEELGLVGSWWFVEHRPAGMQQIVANVNLDMVGRNAPEQLYDFGEVWSSVGTLTRSVLEGHPELAFHMVGLTNEDRGFERSDQFPFAWSGIPAIFLNSGTHAQYHTPADEASLIDNEKVSRVSRLAFYLANELANQSDRPYWKEGWQAARASFQPIRGTCIMR